AADPVPKLRQRLVNDGQGDAVTALENEINTFIEACIKISLAVPRPVADVAKLCAEVYAPPAAPIAWQPEPAETTELNFAQAINRGLRKILHEHPDSLILGQDIATYGGAFIVTDGMLADFGRSRVLNTPLAESACTGYATGLALGGHR